MKCFYRHDQEAVGLCKSCGKALCPYCSVDLGKGLACKDRCEPEVRRLIAMTEISIAVTAKVPQQFRANRLLGFGTAWLFTVPGALLVALGVAAGHPTAGYVFLGGFLLVFGLALMILASRMPRYEDRQPDDRPADAG